MFHYRIAEQQNIDSPPIAKKRHWYSPSYGIFVCSDDDGQVIWGVNYKYHSAMQTKCRIYRSIECIYNGGGCLEDMEIVNGVPLFVMKSTTPYFQSKCYSRAMPPSMISRVCSLTEKIPFLSISDQEKATEEDRLMTFEYVQYVYGKTAIFKKDWKKFREEESFKRSLNLRDGRYVPLCESGTYQVRLKSILPFVGATVPSKKRIVLLHQKVGTTVLPGLYRRVLSVIRKPDGSIVCGVMTDAHLFSRIVFVPAP
jgi:hypothetical protein